MLNLPAEVAAFLVQFAPLFTPSVWYHAQVLVVGALLTPGKRTVTAILSVMGLRQHRHFQNYHGSSIARGGRVVLSARSWCT